jgi:hypothetical protein
MSLSDRIQLATVLISSITAISSIIISVLTLRQTNKITREANRAYINIYLDVIAMNGNNSVYFIIKNHGNTPGKIIDIKCSLLDVKKVFILNPFEHLINFELAPKQSFSTFVKTDGIGTFTCDIKYSQGKKIYKDTFLLNPSFADGVIHIDRESNPPKEISDTIRNETEALIKSKF